MAADVKIDIAAEFTGKKAFRQAETATDKMSKNVKKLAGALGLAFGGQAILAYGKKAVKAAAEDEKAQKQLALALKNVGLGRDAASSEDYIQRLQSEFGIIDDKLRPAFQTLAVATRDAGEAQRLLNLSLDISASTGKDLGSVTAALSRAYLGNNAALSRLGVGISKADLKAKSFEDITKELQTTFGGSATQAANTFQGSIDKLGVASANASEIIGTGLIDALKSLGDEDSVDNLATSMENTATYIADVIRGVGVLAKKLNDLGGGDFAYALDIGNKFSILGLLNKLGSDSKSQTQASGINAQGLTDLARLQSEYAVDTLSAKKKITAEENKALKAAKLKLALDKANLALLKGEEVFDLDKIQNEAALKSQAEQLAKATTGTQILQIANDTARLNVKKSILALEDAMASKDEAAIIAATKKLNADLGILGALTGQDAKLKDIKSILDSLKPKDLINLDNLYQALALLKQIAAGGVGGSTTGKLSGAAPLMPSSLNPISGAGGVRAPKVFSNQELQYFEDLNEAMYSDLFAGGKNPFAASSSSGTAGNTIIVNTGVGDPNAIAEAIDQVLTDAFQRGTLRQYATP